MAHDGSEPDYLGFDYPHTSADGQFALFATAATNLVPYDTEPNSVIDVFRAANPLAAPDQDGDGLPDSLEDAGCTDSLDADSDDDGLADGSEDANWNGTQDAGETEPCDADSDDDGVEDGTEDGRTTVAFELDLDGPIAGTDPSAFTPDSDPFTTTASLDPDSDGDGALDGAEDINGNGEVDLGEYDPLGPLSKPPFARAVPALALALRFVLGSALIGLGFLGLRTRLH
jgi:hypothetical protein